MSRNCIRCGKPAGFWVSSGKTARRPWCWACITRHLDRDTVTIKRM